MFKTPPTFSIIILSIFCTILSCSPLKEANRNAEKNAIKTIYPKLVFDSLQAKRALSYGKSTITGVVYANDSKLTGGGGRVYGKNVLVTLFPVTPYFKEWYDLRKKEESSKTYVYMSDAAFRYRIETMSDDYGRFTFEKMKPGKYFLQSFLNWKTYSQGKEYVGSATDGYYTTNYYQWQTYYQDKNARVEEFLEIKEDGSTISVKLK